MTLSRILPYSFFDWCESTLIGNWLKEAMWAFATIETVHIMALAVLLGTMVVIDLRLLGLGLKRMAAPELAALLAPWFWGSLAVMILSGACLFSGEAVRLGTSAPFAIKMLFLVIAIVVHSTIHRCAIAGDAAGPGVFTRLAAYMSLICWLGIALAGRAIAFL